MTCFCRISPVEQYICPNCRWYMATHGGKRPIDIATEKLTEAYKTFFAAMEPH